jgi:hypothetical protein
MRISRGGGVQFDGDVSRVVYCKAWILGCCALQLMAFNAASDGPQAAEGTQDIIRNLLEASDDQGHLMYGAVPGEARLRGALVACLGSLASVGGIDIGRSWREHKVCAAVLACTSRFLMQAGSTLAVEATPMHP